MPKNPTFLYHRTNPQGVLYPDLTPELERQLTAEGWVDTPDKLAPAHRDAGDQQSAQAERREAPASLSTGSGRSLADDEPLAGPATEGTDILGSSAALERMGKFFDADYDNVSGALSDAEFVAVLDAMSREEVIEAAERLGFVFDFGEQTAEIRRGIAVALRPSLVEEEAEPDGEPEERPVKQAPPAPTDPLEMSDEQLEAFFALDSSTKAVLGSHLTKWGVTFKPRDGKEELQEAVRLHVAASRKG